MFLWLALLIGIIGLIKLTAPGERDAEDPMAGGLQQATQENDDDGTLLADATGECRKVFSGFLAAEEPEAQSQFVMNQFQSLPRMHRFREHTLVARLEPGSLAGRESALIHIPGRKALGIHYLSPSDQLVDAVFFEENGAWKLDWEHFVRYQPEMWGLFCTEQGGKESEFRLLVRERVIRDSADTSLMHLVFSPPRFGRPKESGQPLVRLTIQRESPEGHLLSAAFKLRKEGRSPFHCDLAPVDDEDMVRVRAVIRRTDERDEEGDRKFELVSIKACHWMSVDEPGVDPKDARGRY